MISLFFGELHFDYFCYLKCLFPCFEGTLGLKINLTKSELVPVDNVPNVNGLGDICAFLWVFCSRLNLFGMLLLRKWREDWWGGKGSTYLRLFD